MVAAIQEFGATIQHPARQQTIFRKLAAEGTGFLRQGRFVKRSESNFSTTHAVPAHAVVIPPRPFFRQMIAANGKSWGPEMAKLLRADDFDPLKALAQMGALIAGQLVKSIQGFTSPPNAPSTIRRKGFAKPLIDTGLMWQSVDYSVQSGS